MEVKHNLDVLIYVNENDIEYKYWILQFVVDDKLSVCLPQLLIEHTE